MKKKTEKRFNGKPMSHWRREAKKLVIDHIYRGSLIDTRSILGKMVSDRLMFLAQLEDDGSGLLQEIQEERGRFQAGVASVINEITQPAKLTKAMSKKVVRCSRCGKKLRLLSGGIVQEHEAEDLASASRHMSFPALDDYYETVRCPGMYKPPHKGRWPWKIGRVR